MVAGYNFESQACYASRTSFTRIMKSLRYILRKNLVMALIPLTLFSGRMQGACVCAEGRCGLICDGQGCCSHETFSRTTEKSRRHECCGSSASRCPQAVHQVGGQRQDVRSHARQRVDDISRSHCQRLEPSPMAASKDYFRQFHNDLAAVEGTVSLKLLPSKDCQPERRCAFDPGPPRARLILLQHFLI